MSTEPLSSEAVEQTRQHIHSIMAEVAALARSDIEPRDFYDGFLSRVVSTMAATGGAVWTMGQDGTSFELPVAGYLPQSGMPQDAESQRLHAQIIGRVFSTGEAVLVPAGTRSADEAAGGNPTHYLLVLAPLRSKRQAYGVVEILQRPGASPATQRGYLQFLIQMCDLAVEYLTARELVGLAERETLWSRFEQFGHAVHQSLEVQETTYTLANEACRLIECDRVSVAIRRRNRLRIVAVSGQDTVETRADIVRLLTELTDVVLATGESLWYVGSSSDLPPQIEDALHAYIDQSHTRTLAIIPLIQPQPERSDEETPLKPAILGALIVERIDREGLPDTMRQRIELVSRHGTSAVANALTHDRVFLMPVWRTLGKSRWFVEARRLPKTLAVCGGLLVVLVALCVIRADFRITARGTLQTAERRDVFVHEAGVVSEVLVNAGQRVTLGQELVRLKSRDLEVAITELRGRMASTLEQLTSIRRTQGESRLSFDERNRFSGQFAQLQKTYDSLSEQLGLLQEKQKLLSVASPLDGIVVTWDVKNRLLGRPVEKGQLLLSLANPQKEWELELMVPEAHAGYVTQAWQEAARDKRDLQVSYILATNPATVHTGKVTAVQPSAEIRGDEGNTVLVRVKIDDQDLNSTELRPGATVSGRISCGRRALGYVWFHDVLAFIRSKILFRI
ncbi:MAG: HlyD family efflux transporter periplasmic adaptor subunit [Planctomycetes bacterium]|nr:HlyD family efflux transporter periplasmic adaptor subunit [Planctomycetota bacterium]